MYSIVINSQQIKVLASTTTPRFTNSNRVWSSTFGNVNVCEWKDDKLATVSVTIDDNHYQPDNAYWMQKASETGWKWTWFLIASRIDTNPTYNGSWAQWSVVKAAGHDLQSHSQNHCSVDMQTADLEYSLAKTNINNNITGANVQTLAYPNGYPGCSNDSLVSKNYYLSSRGVYGAVPTVTKINFHNVNSIGNFNNFSEVETHFASFTGALNPANATKFRTWYVALFHNLTDVIKTQIESAFTYIKQNEADIWVATYTDAAKYAQEFATNSIANMSVTANQISFDLKDKMYDTWYDYPLTIKVNINGWTDFTVTQNGLPIGYKVVTNGSNKYVFLDAVPDKGTVVLTNTSTTLSTIENVKEKIDFDSYEIYDTQFRLIKQKTKYKVNFETEGLPSGFYFIVLIKNNQKIKSINYRK